MFSAAPAAEKLNIKPGLWEVTTTTEGKGSTFAAMSAADKAAMEKAMAEMPPDMRAKTEAYLKSAQAKAPVNPLPPVRKACVTKEGISKTYMVDVGVDQAGCKNTILKSTSTTLETRGECIDSARKVSITMLVVAANPESWTNTMEISGSAGLGESKIKMSGKWLGAACGDVKP